MKKLVLFGAGKIGRSFIGQLFSRGGFEVVFIDIFQEVVDALNEKTKYKVVIKANEGDSVIWVKNVRSVIGTDIDKVVDEVATADFCGVSVGQRGLPHILPNIAKGLLKRKADWPLDIIIAENMRDADKYVEQVLKETLPADYDFNKLVGLVETSIGKMVPIMTQKDMEEDNLQVFAEAYNALILDKKGFKNPVPKINGLAPKENMKAWVDRKLFIHNLGHAAAAYLGYLDNPDFTYIWEALSNSNTKQKVRETMFQAGDILMALYAGEFDKQHIIDHTDDLISRFENKALGDTIFRVGCDLQRKLSKEDRLFGAIRKAKSLNLPYNLILDTAMAGFKFKATDEKGKMFAGDVEFHKQLDEKGEKVLLKELSGFEV